MTYTEALQTVYSYIRHQPTLDTQRARRTQEVLSRGGNPQQRVPVVHVTGTKGKGSVSVMIASVLKANGLRVGLYTSPHLHSLRERIRVDGEPISKSDFAALVDAQRPHLDAVEGVGFPEVMTTLAYHHFAAVEVDVAVMEVHLGGRYDATNVITPLCSVINVIDYDHTHILGDDLTSIAEQKAGIIKAGVPVVSAPQPLEALEVIQQTAKEKNAPLTTLDEGQSFMLAPPTAVGQSVWMDGELYETNLCGVHQGVNLALALLALRVLDEKFSLRSLRAGLNNVQWAGRLEYVERWGVSFLLDIAHNPAAARSLRAYRDAVYPDDDWTILYGSKVDKDVPTILDIVMRPMDRLVLTQVDDPTTAAPDELYQVMGKKRSELAYLEHEPNLAQALRLSRLYGAQSLVCVTGSIFIVSAARAILLGIEPETGSAH